MKQPNQKTIIILLVILLALALIYIAFKSYNEKQSEIFQQGTQYGYEQAVLEMMQELSTCDQVPLFANNQTINAVAVECLQKQEPT
jgi:hypothetical protein